ncbi:hypothetical protein C8N25_101267 [Algoriphagus antarcticus]|uniref:Uncharacterized protein n=1 Tax=Algoriphagus antarcticus TaxID=238540 RepID=A0A3E0E9W1_9BACT|nr:hypothetical protein C8N25_101267 [Algoriphagus antarcticus]
MEGGFNSPNSKLGCVDRVYAVTHRDNSIYVVKFSPIIFPSEAGVYKMEIT